MEPKNWVDLLFTYGPYAELALFVLWVAPKQTKLFLACDRSDSAKCRVTGGIVAACWLVILVMVWFVYSSWPPRTIYTGSLGIHTEDIVFTTTDEYLYVTAIPIGIGGGRFEWKYVIVAESGDL